VWRATDAPNQTVTAGPQFNDRQSGLGGLPPLDGEMRLEELPMVRRLLIMVRRRRHGEDGDAGVETGAHQSVDHRLRHELMAVYATVGDEGGRNDG
jgi:hypothetical protein